MALFARRADVSLFYVGRYFGTVSTAIGQFKRSPKIVSCTTMTTPPSGPTYIDAVIMETIGAPNRDSAEHIILKDVFVGMKTRLPSNYKVPVSLDTADLPRRVRLLYEETRKQHATILTIASFSDDPASKPLLVNSVELRIGRHISGNEEEYLAEFIFSHSRFYTFLDRLRGFFVKK